MGDMPAISTPRGPKGASAGVHSGETSSRPLIIASVLFLVGGFLLRFMALDRQSLWSDEIMSLFIAGAPYKALFDRAAAIQGQSPFYYVVLRAWGEVFGLDSAVAVRSLSATLGVVALGQIWFLARRFLGFRIAVGAMAVAASSPFLIYASQEARMYPLLTCLVLAATHLVLVICRMATANLWPAGALALVAALAFYTHYFAFLFLGALDVFVLFHARRRPRAFWAIVGAQALAVLLYIPWVPALLHASASGGNEWFQYVGLKGLYALFVFAVGYSSVIVDALAKTDLVSYFAEHAPRIATTGIAFGWLVYMGCKHLWRADREMLLLLALMVGAPIIAALGISQFFPIFSERYVAPGAAFFCLLVGCGIMTGRGVLHATAVLVAVVLVGHSLYSYYFSERYGFEDWRAAATYVERHAEERDALVFVPEFVRDAYEFYSDATRTTYTVRQGEPGGELPRDRAYWVIVSHAQGGERPLIKRMQRHFHRVEEHFLPRGEGIRIYRYAPREAADSGRKPE